MSEPNHPTPTQRLYHPSGTRNYSIPLPVVGEAIMLRLPFAVTLGPPSVISGSAVTNATGSNYHLCFVSSVVSHATHVRVQVWVCLGFSTALPSPSHFVRGLSDEWRACLLPVPFSPQTPPIPIPPTSAAFGTPLHTPGFLARKPSWLVIAPVRVILHRNPFKRFTPPGLLEEREVGRLLAYAASRTVPALPRSPDHPSSDGGAGTGASHPPVPPRATHPAPPGPTPGQGASFTSSGGGGFTTYAIDSSDEESEQALYIDDDDDDDSDDASYDGDIGLDGYVAMVKGYSQLMARMADEELRKRDLSRAETMEAWLAGVEGV